MAMKKKFLGLALATMVAMPATGVYAAGNTQTITGKDTSTLNHTIPVTGSVTKSDGTAAAGQITVELPTKMAFAVDKVGNLTGGTYTVKNSSKDAIDVYVSEFRRTSGDIEVKQTISSDTDNRSKVKLELTGNTGTAVNLADSQLDGTSDGVKVANVKGNNTGNITLTGEAGKANESGVDQNGASAEFNMVFKVKKA